MENALAVLAALLVMGIVHLLWSVSAWIAERTRKVALENERTELELKALRQAQARKTEQGSKNP